MVEFKAKADAIIKERWGIDVEHICAMRNGEKLTYEKLFYHVPKRKGGNFSDGAPAGFPYTKGAYCNDRLKTNVLDAISNGTGIDGFQRRGGHVERTASSKHQVYDKQSITGFPFTISSWCKKLKAGSYTRIPNAQRELVQETQSRVLYSDSQCSKGIGATAISNAVFSKSALERGAQKSIVQYLGIAANEPERIKRHTKPGFKLPLVEIGWTEADCRKWCEENDLLSPIYTTASRGGCWFCHNQSVDQLRLLRRTYPDLWALLMKWDLDSPVSFRPDGHTVHDFDRRFEMEEQGKVPRDRTFRWKMVDSK